MPQKYIFKDDFVSNAELGKTKCGMMQKSETTHAMKETYEKSLRDYYSQDIGGDAYYRGRSQAMP